MKRALAVLVLLAGAWLAREAHGKTFRYDSGPKAPEDTVLSTATSELEPIVRARGPKVPLTNLQLVTLVAKTGFDRTLQSAPLDSGGHVTLAPAENHPLNYVVEHAILRHLARRAVTATVRRSIVPDDSVSVMARDADDPLLEYQLASARITYLRLRGWLPGRVKIERQALVEGALTLRDPRTGNVLWSGDVSHNLLDAVPRSQIAMVEDPRYAELKADPPSRSVDKAIEPIIVVAIVAGLIALFFQNRP